MRANNASSGLQTYVNSSPDQVGMIASEPAPNCLSGATCSATELAVHDWWSWEQVLQGKIESVGSGASTVYTGGLMNPSVCVTGPAGGAGSSGVYTVTIAWRGAIDMPVNSAIPCGLGSGTLYGASDEYRRTLQVSTFIANR
jgi:hypothetical protein